MGRGSLYDYEPLGVPGVGDPERQLAAAVIGVARFRLRDLDPHRGVPFGGEARARTPSQGLGQERLELLGGERLEMRGDQASGQSCSASG